MEKGHPTSGDDSIRHGGTTPLPPAHTILLQMACYGGHRVYNSKQETDQNVMTVTKAFTIMTTSICGRARQKPILRHMALDVCSSPNCKFVLALMHPTDE